MSGGAQEEGALLAVGAGSPVDNANSALHLLSHTPPYSRQLLLCPPVQMRSWRLRKVPLLVQGHRVHLTSWQAQLNHGDSGQEMTQLGGGGVQADRESVSLHPCAKEKEPLWGIHGRTKISWATVPEPMQGPLGYIAGTWRSGQVDARKALGMEALES